MEEGEWVDLSEVPLIADVTWLHEKAKAAYEASTNGTHPDKEDSWTPRNLAELEDKPPVEPTLGHVGLVYPGKRHVFSGPQESAKTLAAYVIGLSLVRDGSSVVLIDFEMGPWDAKTRLRELGATDEELAGFLYVAPESSPTDGDVGGLLSREPSLVIVDAASGAFDIEGYDDNSRRDVEKWAGRWVNPFWKAGIATIVLDHVVKNADLRGNYAIGSERKVGGADVHLGFSCIRPIKRGDHGLYKVTTHKDRGGMLRRGHLVDFKLVSDPDSHAISWEFVVPPVVDDDHPWRPHGLMEVISRLLETAYEPMSKARIEGATKGKTDYKRQAIQYLIDDGFAAQTSEGIESTRPYREAEQTLAPTSPHLAPFDKVPRPPLESAPRGAVLRGDGTEGGGEVEGSPLEEDDGIPF